MLFIYLIFLLVKIIMIPNASSFDFPFKTKFGNVAQKEEKKIKHNEHSKYTTNEYNNELPDIFRLDSMTPSSRMYNNPFLNEVIPVDRSEFYKNYERTHKNILLIDKLKRNIKLSQEPSILRNIRNENDFFSSRMIKSNSTNNILKPKIEITKDNYANYDKTIRALYKNNSPKIGFRIKNEIETSKLESIDDTIKCSPKDKEKIEKLQSIIDSHHSGYIGNINNYSIKENYKENKRCKFEFIRKEKEIYNPITNERKIVKPDVFTNDKWDAYSETFELLKNNLRRKGGLFSEFANKNKAIYNMIQIEKKLQKKSPIKNKSKKKGIM